MSTTQTQAAVARAWLRDERRVACALLVGVEGSAPLAPGATMLVDADGRIEGSITGGCVESAVAQEAEAVLAGAAARLVTYGISDELAGTAGLTCGGTVHVLVHLLAADDARTALAALDAAAAGRPAAIATLLDGPRAGAKLAVVCDGSGDAADGSPPATSPGDRVVGSLRGPALLDDSVARDASGLLDRGVTTVRSYGADGATLGADLRVHVRSFAAPPQLVVFGANDFSAALAPIAKELGYAVTIGDARERFARADRFARAAAVAVQWPGELLAGRTLGPRDAVLVFTHDPKFDEPALHAALASGAGYVGALGSHATTADRNRRLRAAGLTDEQLARIHAPCGLDIGGRTPEETAISVLGEIVAHRAGRPGGPLRATAGPIQPRGHAA
jgi:xanthine dehydrogenase accessory factor